MSRVVHFVGDMCHPVKVTWQGGCELYISAVLYSPTPTYIPYHGGHQQTAWSLSILVSDSNFIVIPVWPFEILWITSSEKLHLGAKRAKLRSASSVHNRLNSPWSSSKKERENEQSKEKPLLVPLQCKLPHKPSTTRCNSV